MFLQWATWFIYEIYEIVYNEHIQLTNTTLIIGIPLLQEW